MSDGSERPRIVFVGGPYDGQSYGISPKEASSLARTPFPEREFLLMPTEPQKYAVYRVKVVAFAGRSVLSVADDGALRYEYVEDRR